MIIQKSLHFLKPYKRCIWICRILKTFIPCDRSLQPVPRFNHKYDVLPSNQNYYLRVVSESDSCGTNLDMTQAPDGAHSTVITNKRTDNSVSQCISSSGKLHSKMPCLPTRTGTSLTSHTLCKMCGF